MALFLSEAARVYMEAVTNRENYNMRHCVIANAQIKPWITRALTAKEYEYIAKDRVLFSHIEHVELWVEEA